MFSASCQGFFSYFISSLTSVLLLSAVVCAVIGLDFETMQESRIQCLGSVRDEAVIDEVVRILLEDLKKKPILSSRSVRRRLNSGGPTSSTYAVGERRRKSADAIIATGIKFVAGRVAVC